MRIVMAGLKLQIDDGLSSWRECISVKPITAASGQGVNALLQHILDLVPKWSSFMAPYRLNAWRYKMAQGLGGLCVCNYSDDHILS